MTQFGTLSIGMEIHKASIAVAAIAKDYDADLISLGTLRTRQCDIDTLVRNLQGVPRVSEHLVVPPMASA